METNIIFVINHIPKEHLLFPLSTVNTCLKLLKINKPEIYEELKNKTPISINFKVWFFTYSCLDFLCCIKNDHSCSADSGTSIYKYNEYLTYEELTNIRSQEIVTYENLERMVELPVDNFMKYFDFKMS